MTQTPNGAPRRRRAEQQTSDSRSRAESRASAAAAARSAARPPMGRSEELRRRQQAMQQAREYAAPERRFRQPVSDDTIYDDFAVYDRDNRQVYSTRRRDPHAGLWILLTVVCWLCIGALGMFLAPQLLGVRYASMPNCAFVNGSVIDYDPERIGVYNQYREYMRQDVIFPGVYVDGVHVGGMTVAEAREATRNVAAQGGGEFAVTVHVGNKSWSIDSSRVPMTRNLDEVLAQAYAYGRSNTTAIRGTGVTPFQERLTTAQNLRSQPVALHTQLTYDKAAVRGLVDDIADFVNRAPVNASVATFDFNTRSFTFNSDTPGSWISAEDLYNQIISLVDSGQHTATIVVEPQIQLASITKSELMNSFCRISSFTTETTSNSNRNTNVQLSANAINGITVMPGETFSFNRATGERTAAKGYLPAAAIAGGQSVDEIGGGVCQTSSTLFNAVARADLEIVSRSPHAWPSNYVEKGMDATVNWPNLDFKFRNNTDQPIFIVANYRNRKVTVEIYGMSLGDGVSIDLESEVTRTINPSSEIIYKQNPELAFGEMKTTIKARKGYEVSTYKVWYQNGKEIRRELLCESRYKAYQETVEYN